MKHWLRILAVYVVAAMMIMMAGCGSQTVDEVSPVKADTVHSELLGKDMKLNVYLPNGYDEKVKYPVLYMIHGYGGNEDSWVQLELTKKADELIESKKISPLIIVMPAIENSYGINSSKDSYEQYNNNFGMYEDYIIKELINYIDSAYSTEASREGRFIGGLSMGGFAALHLGLEHNDMFSKVGGHSPAIWFEGMEHPDARYVLNWLFPTEQDKKERDPLILAENRDLSKTKVWLDCGNEDEYTFYNGCEKLDDILKSKNVDVQYHLNPGKHSGEYWRSNAENYLMFYAGQ